MSEIGQWKAISNRKRMIDASFYLEKNSLVYQQTERNLSKLLRHFGVRNES